MSSPFLLLSKVTSCILFMKKKEGGYGMNLKKWLIIGLNTIMIIVLLRLTLGGLALEISIL